MQRLPQLSDYELFAYLASGFAFLVMWDVWAPSNIVLGANWTVLYGVYIALLSYVLGQIIATPSELVLERWFTSKVLLAPSITLMNCDPRLRKRSFLKRSLLGEYYRPLDANQRSNIDVINTEGLTGEALFWNAFVIAKQDMNAYSRMYSFLKLYGFCRNMAFVLLLSSSCILIDIAVDSFCGQTGVQNEQKLRYAVFAFVAGLGMLHRYLKFYRLYSLEVFLSYASSNPMEGSSR